VEFGTTGVLFAVVPMEVWVDDDEGARVTITKKERERLTHEGVEVDARPKDLFGIPASTDKNQSRGFPGALTTEVPFVVVNEITAGSYGKSPFDGRRRGGDAECVGSGEPVQMFRKGGGVFGLKGDLGDTTDNDRRSVVVPDAGRNRGRWEGRNGCGLGALSRGVT
jgi:hypothetical protein